MFTDKLTLAIAEAAKKCMDEELKGNQHKIDANKNGKIDADDFKKLRKEELKGNQHKIDANKNGKIDADDFKKLRKEESVNEESAHVYDTKTDKVHSTHGTYKKALNAMKKLNNEHPGYETPGDITRDKFGVRLAKKSVQEGAIDDLRDRQAAEREANSYKSQDKKEPTVRKVQGSNYGGSKQKHEKEVEESVQLDELSRGTLTSYVKKSVNDRVDRLVMSKPKSGEEAVSNMNKNMKRAQGQTLALSKLAKEETELQEKRKIKPADGEWDVVDDESGETHSTHDSYKKAISTMHDLNKNHPGKEIPNTNLIRNKYMARAKNAYSTHTREQVEQLDELSTSTLDNYRTKANSSGYNSKTTQQKLDNRSKGMNLAWSKTMPAKNDEMNPNKAKVKAGDYRFNKEEVEQIEESGGKVVYTSGDDHVEMYGEDAYAVYKNGKKQKYYSTLSAAKEALKEEVEVLDESKAHIEQHLADRDINSKVVGKTVKVHSSDVASATKHVKMAGYKDHKVVGGLNEEKMSDEDMAQREKIVKGMKKNLQGFKARYGDDAKKVMYATATKQAMKEEWKPYGKTSQKDLDDLHNNKNLVHTGKVTTVDLGKTKAIRHDFDHSDPKQRDHSDYDRDTRVSHNTIHHNDKIVAHAMHDTDAGGIIATHAKTGRVTHHSNIDDATKHYQKMYVSKLKEEVKDKYDEGEYDREGDMAKSDLRSIIANAQKLHDMIEDADNLPEWVQSKITKSEDYISTVANYMTSEMSEEIEQIDELSKDTLKSYVKKAVKDTRMQGVQQMDYAHKSAQASTPGMKKTFHKISTDAIKKGHKREDGIMSAVNKLAKEEVTNDQFKAELEDNKAKAAGTKKQPDVHKAAVQSVKQESFSEKLSMLKENARSFLKGKNNG
jgi:hypothetical protein